MPIPLLEASTKILPRLAVLSILLFSTRRAFAAEPWVDRTMILPRHDWAFDIGFGIAHVPNNYIPPPGFPAPEIDTFGQGFNVEGAVAVTTAVQLGLRAGLRFKYPARYNGPGGADAYARPFDTETYGTGGYEVANPEFYVRGSLVQGAVAELGLEGRIYAPFGGELGMMLGVPFMFHIGGSARIDTGLYVPVYLGMKVGDEGDSNIPMRAIISLPLHVWFQLTDKLWLGPLLGVRFFGCPEVFDNSDCRNRISLPVGFGLGYQILRELDFKAQVISQDVTPTPNPYERTRSAYWGLGAGIEIRIE